MSGSFMDTPAALPRHVAIIMDGNGRWAKARGLSRSEGHRAGVAAAQRVVEECLDFGIRHLTLYAFSTENWNRPADEVRFLFDLLVDYITRELADFTKRGIRVRQLGEPGALPFAARKALDMAIKRTSGNEALNLNLALNYSGREELARAFRQMTLDGRKPEEITPELISAYLYTCGQPDPDLVIRTSGELRVSNFLLFQAAYSEFHFTDTYWPDFDVKDFHAALGDFTSRKRRFGRVDEPDSPEAQPET